MAKCSRCHHKKAKRHCPALGSPLCSLCCGTLREKKIHCTPNCTFLAQHKPYQEKRIIEKRPGSSFRAAFPHEGLLKDERMRWLIFKIEAVLKEWGENQKSFTDKDAILALEYAKEKIEKGKGLIILPGEEKNPKNATGEAVYQNVENCHYQKSIILEGATEAFKKEEKILCLDHMIETIKYIAQDRFEGRTYIHQLLEHFSKIKELSRQKKIITLQ
jgi:hypothetical protein